MALAVRQSSNAAQIPAPYISTSEAAVRMNRTPRQMQRWAADELAAKSLAKMFDGAWGIHPSADLRLSNIETWRDRDLRQLAALRAEGVKPKFLAMAEERRDLVVGIDDFDGPGNSATARLKYYLASRAADGAPKVSVSTWYGWRAAYERADDDGGIRALVPAWTNGATGDKEPIGPAAWDYADRLMNGHNSIRAAMAYVLTLGHRRNQGLDSDPAWRMPKLRQFQQEARRRRPRIVRELARKGERYARGACTPHAQRDIESLAVNEWWVGDERTLDIMSRAPGARNGGWRACRILHITAWEDVRTRKVTAVFVADHANSKTIAAALKRGIRADGKPALLLIDNGRDYFKALGVEADPDDPSSRNYPIAKSLRDLSIEVKPVTPYLPEAKPIESFFRGMKEHLDKVFAAFCGGRPEERHEDFTRWCREHLHELPTVADVEKAVLQYVEIYNRTPHSGRGMYGLAPLEAAEKFRAGPARYETDAVLDHCFGFYTEPRLVRRDGVYYRNYLYGFCDAALGELQGSKVLLRIQPDDASRAMVCRLDTTPLFEVRCAQLDGMTLHDLDLVMRHRQRVLKKARQRVRDGRDLILSKSPTEFLADRKAGLEALHGEIDASAAHRAPRLTIARPALEEALSKAAPPPVESDSKAALAATGTDDESAWFSDDDAPSGPTPARNVDHDDEVWSDDD